MKRSINRVTAVLLCASVLSASACFNVSGEENLITESGGSFEYAYVKWNAAGSASVEYKEAGTDTYIPVKDSELIRGNRADIPGLKGNTEYTVKVTAGGVSQEVTVKTKSYNRDGYAHFNRSGIGAYNDDGTLKSDADVIYVTNENKNTVKYGSYTGIGNILKNSNKLTKPLAVRFIGKVDTQTRDADGSKTTDKNNGIVAINGLTDRDMGDDSYFNMCDMSSPKNITLEGIGDDALIEKWGFCLDKASSIEVRNLSFAKYPEDAIGIEGGSSSHSRNIWIHNNSFEPGYNAYDRTDEQDKGDGDGSTDIKYADYITVSGNYYHACHKTSLIGGGTSHMQDYITYSGNFFDETYERTPRVRNAHVHVYNNYYKGVTGYGIGASHNSKIFSEANYFENTNVPITMGPVGSDKYGGTVKSYADVFENCTNKGNPDSAKEVSYVEAKTRDEIMTIANPKSGGDSYDNFDTDSSKFYTGAYSVMSAAEAKSYAAENAGVLKLTPNGTINPNPVDPDPVDPDPVDPVIPEGLIYGDADNSGTLTSNDAAYVFKKAVDPGISTPLEEKNGAAASVYLDVNADGKISANDAAEILSKVIDPSLSFAAEKK